MAEDWIRVREDLHEQPEVLTIAREIKERPEVVTGYCLRFWSWASRMSRDGVIANVTLDDVESVLNMPLFLHMLCKVGWLEFIESTDGCQIKIPNWDRWLSDSSKKRAQAARRQQKKRHADVTQTSRSERDKSVTREEKRREEKNNKRKVNQKKSFVVPSVDEVRAYCQSRTSSVDPQKFVDHYTSNGWMVGRNSMKDWKAAVRNWERNGQYPNGSEAAIAAKSEEQRKLEYEAMREKDKEKRKRLREEA